DLDAGDVGVDLLVGAAVGRAGLQIESVHLTGAAVHPQQDAGAAAARVGGGVVGQRLQPAGQRTADDGRGHQANPATARKRMSHGYSSFRTSFPRSAWELASSTLYVVSRHALGKRHVPARHAGRDAERPSWRSHAERGNEEEVQWFKKNSPLLSRV